jgi:uncharacterized lipoprotein
MIRPLLVVVPLLTLVGCSGDQELRCESTERYQGARTVQPVRVPDDLSVPDESDALRIPPPPDGASAARETCLEYPPEF